MAKDKERSVNPAQAQRKADKAKALKKSRNEQQARRNEKLARQNPNRVQRQIDDLKALEASGQIKTREKDILASLERDIKAIYKAREAQGDRVPPRGNRPQTSTREAEQGGDRSLLGKRDHDGRRKRYQDNVSSGSETDESVRNIPMPRDTPPPMPREHRRGRPATTQQNQQRQQQQQPSTSRSGAVMEHKTTYSSAPQLRDLKKEAVSRFVPDAVRRKQDAAKGYGGLLEPEEMDKLEQEGYYRQHDRPQEDQNPDGQVSANEPRSLSDEESRRLQEEEARFAKELAEGFGDDMEIDGREVEMEEEAATVTQPPNASSNSHIPPNETSNQVNKQIDKGVDEADSESDDDYLPPILSGITKSSATQPSVASTLFSNLPKPQSSSIIGAGASSGGSGGSAGLFSSLPKPQSQSQTRTPIPRRVEMEEVQDEDL